MFFFIIALEKNEIISPLSDFFEVHLAQLQCLKMEKRSNYNFKIDRFFKIKIVTPVSLIIPKGQQKPKFFFGFI